MSIELSTRCDRQLNATTVPPGPILETVRTAVRSPRIGRGRIGAIVRRLLSTCFRWLPDISALSFALNGSYAWEFRANAAGRKLYAQHLRLQQGDSARYELRRGVHRLEKGLVSRPRKHVFGEKYLNQVVTIAGQLAVQGQPEDRVLLGWARDVLTLYFQSVDTTPKVASARSRFEQIQFSSPQGEEAEPAQVPYCRDSSPLPTSIDDLQRLARRRRSVRWFQPRPVPRPVVDRAVEIARWSPSACNRQPFVFRFYDDPSLVREIVQIPMGATGFVGEVPCLCVVVGQLRAFREPRDRHVIYIDAALACMALQFGLEVQGVSSCCINWPEISKLEHRLVKQIGLAADERPVMLLAIGYPEPQASVPYSQKKPIEIIRTFNQVSAEP